MSDVGELTMTACGACGTTSEVDEQMIGCDSCDRWFHSRCVDVTTDKMKEEKWFCPATECQQVYSEYLKKIEKEGKNRKKKSNKNKPLGDETDSISSKSAKLGNPDSALEKRLKELEEEQKAKEKEMEYEMIILERRMEMERALKEKRLKMENAIRAKQREDEKALLEKALADEKNHLEELKKMRDSFAVKMSNVQSEMKQLQIKGEGSKKVLSTPLRNPEVAGPKQVKEKKGKGRVQSRCDIEPDDSEEDTEDEEGEEEETDEEPESESEEESEEDAEEEEYEEAEDDSDQAKKKKKSTKPKVTKNVATNGLGRHSGPTRAQMAARNGVTKKLPVFTGRPEEWPLFIGSYEASNEACGFTAVENLVRLQECLKGPALESVRGQLLFPKSVPKVISKLQQLYGRPEQLLQCQLEKVRKLEPPKADKLATFIPFGTAVEQLCEHLETAGLKQHLVNPLLVQELVDKLPVNDKREWVRYKKRKKTVNLRTFTNFLSGIVAEACEANVSVEFKPERKVGNYSSAKGRNMEKGAVYNHSGTEPVNSMPAAMSRQKACNVCKRTDHRLRFCQDFRNMSPTERAKVVQRWKLCEVCLNDHGNAECKFRMRCTIDGCTERHNPLLHQGSGMVVMNAHIRLNSSILFRMLPVTLYFRDKSVTTLAFLDEGASVTMVEKALADQLGAEGIRQRLEIKWTGDVARVEKDSKRISLKISAARGTQQLLMNEVCTVKELALPEQSLNVQKMAERYEHLRDLPVTSYSQSRPRILIGLNNLHIMAPIDARLGRPGEPIAVKSPLGWTVYGPNRRAATTSAQLVGYHEEVTNQEIHDLIKQQYALEESVICTVKESVKDKRAREILERTTVRIGDRFETGLLWKFDDPQFPDMAMALRRNKQLENRLDKHPKLRESVHKLIEEYQGKGYAHLATPEEISNTKTCKVWYLPLDVVVNPLKGKVRLVWDGRASVNGVSLNSQLMKGPDMLTSLPAVINRFRERRIGFGGDIREMYHQIKIRKEDRQAQRFLFRAAKGEPPKVYVMDVATFGSTCSPSSAQFVKNKNALEFAAKFPEAVEAILQKHYVDDYYDSVDTEEEAVHRASEVRFVHSKGGFDIRNWVSNSAEVLRQLGEEKEDQAIHFNKDKESGNERVLGIIWNPKQDVFSFSTEHREGLAEFLRGDKIPTKRIVLSCVMGFFDPLGLLSPFTVHGKILVQELWRTGCDWDDEIEGDCLAGWKRWMSLLPAVEALRIPRRYFGDLYSSSLHSLELHVFTDASESAYGCAAYFRVVVGDHVRCSLVMARSKVAPLKQQSIPRLELMAAVLGVKLLATVKTNHSFPVHTQFLWTDSQTVLSWIRSDPHKYKQAVAFKIGEILENTSVADWRWVPTKMNIADVLTKWGEGPPLESDSQWFRGPDFLYESEEAWPVPYVPTANSIEEMKARFLFHDAVANGPVIDTGTTNRWKKLVRITAAVLRFIDNCRRKVSGASIWTFKASGRQQNIVKVAVKSIQQPFQQSEFQRAEVVLWTQAQSEGFPDELLTLRKNLAKDESKKESLKKCSELYWLKPTLDAEGVMRVDGRLRQAEYMPYDKRFPIILPRGHRITELVIQSYHELFGHANRETVFNELRQKFHIPRLRVVIRKVVSECVWCKVYRCRPQAPQMAALPIQRVTPHVRPFSAVGVDYLGPVLVTIGRRSEKRWVALFTCLTVRAVHLEVVHSLSTQSCLMAIRRFVCKRGMPQEFFSDNGTNFKGASKELQGMVRKINEECAEAVVCSTTKWSFNPPGTPHMGGIWERMVRSVKEATKAFDDGRKVTDEVLQTTLAEAEDMINTRPLTYMPQETANEEAITPNHFLRGTVIADDLKVDGPFQLADTLRDVYRRSQYLADKMWERWYKEYLPDINRWTKWIEDRRPLRVGDLVFVVDGQQRKSWIRGIVQNVIVAADGRVRQAEVRTRKGVFRRALVNLAVLELAECNSGISDERLPELRAGEC